MDRSLFYKKIYLQSDSALHQIISSIYKYLNFDFFISGQEMCFGSNQSLDQSENQDFGIGNSKPIYSVLATSLFSIYIDMQVKQVKLS